MIFTETPDLYVLLEERVTASHLETDHSCAQLIERLGWAVLDAEGLEREWREWQRSPGHRPVNSSNRGTVTARARSRPSGTASAPSTPYSKLGKVRSLANSRRT
jgi:hypothetical protein